MTTPSQTKVGLRIKKRIQTLLANPVEGARKAQAVRGEEETVAKAKRKATKKQLAALAKARTALKAKYGTADIGKISKMKGHKKGKRKAKKSSGPTAWQVAGAAAAAAKPKKKRARRGKKKAAKKTHKKKTHAKKTTRRAAPKKRRSSAKKTHQAVPKKKKRRSKRHTSHTVGGKIHIVKMPVAARVKVIRIEEAKRRRRRKKKALLENPMGMSIAQLEENPLGYSALFENPAGPFSVPSLKSFGWAAGGVGIGLVFAELLDRYVATRAPGKSKDGTADGAQPWMGRNAVAAIQRRPDALRLGVQAGGALASIGGAYLAGRRGGRILPWALGGTAVGFGANLAKQLMIWWIVPMVLKVPVDAQGNLDYSKPSLANRLTALEQKPLQDAIDKLWENYNLVGDLVANQNAVPQISSPLNAATDQSLLTLGGATGNGPLPVAGRPYWVGQPGVGSCMSCGGMQGHWSNCPSNCQDCPDGSGIPIPRDSSNGGSDSGGGGGSGQPRQCEYTVQRGDDLEALLATTGLTMNDVANLNGGGLPTTWWVPGNVVTLPEALCMAIVNRRPSQPSQPPVRQPSQPQQPSSGPNYRQHAPTIPSGGGGQVYRQKPPQLPVIPVVAGVEDQVSRQAALRGVGGEESEDD